LAACLAAVFKVLDREPGACRPVLEYLVKADEEGESPLFVIFLKMLNQADPLRASLHELLQRITSSESAEAEHKQQLKHKMLILYEWVVDGALAGQNAYSRLAWRGKGLWMSHMLFVSNAANLFLSS
jgi:hypothetical protein